MKLNEKAILISPLIDTMNGDATMLLKKQLEFQLEKIKNKEITITSLATVLNCSRTWLSIIYNRYKKGEPLVRKKGYRKRVLSAMQIAAMKELYRYLSYENKGIRYYPAMPLLKKVCSEKIAHFPHTIHIETIRSLLKKEHCIVGAKRRKKYRRRFEAACVGQLIQGDVSTHQWIPESNLSFHLILFIDDKSRYVLYARFVESDNLENHIVALKTLFTTYGYPVAIYYDNDSKYNYIKHSPTFFDVHTTEQQGVIPTALRELGVQLIHSTPYQPQGKGKVERKFLTFQKQLPFYLKLHGAKTIDDANILLDDYIAMHTTTYSTAIKDTPEHVFNQSKDIFKDLYNKDKESMENAFTRRALREVNKVNEIHYANQLFIIPQYNRCSLAHRKVEVRENPGKWIKIFYKNSFLIHYNLHKDKNYDKKIHVNC